MPSSPPTQNRAEHMSLSLWAPQRQDQKTLWKSITRGGQKSMKPLTNSLRNLMMLTQGAVAGISNIKYTIYPIPDNALCLHWDFVQELRRLPMPTGWRELWNQQRPMLCPFSENRCWMRQAMGKNNLNLSQRKGNFFLITAQKTRGAVFPFSFLWVCFLLLFQTGLKLVRLRAISYLPGRPSKVLTSQ